MTTTPEKSQQKAPEKSDEVTLTIDGVEVSVPKNTLVIRAAERIENGEGKVEDLDLLLDLCENIMGRAFCGLGDGATSPISSSIKFFRDEYLAHLTHGGCPFDREASTVFQTAGAAR